MAPIFFPTKRINLEIVFWDLAILIMTLLRHVVGTLLTRLNVDRQVRSTVLTWALWIVAGLSSGWLLGVISR